MRSATASTAAVSVLAILLLLPVLGSTLLPASRSGALPMPGTAEVLVVVDGEMAPRASGPLRGTPAAWDALQLEHYLPLDVRVLPPSDLGSALTSRPAAVVLEQLPGLSPGDLQAVGTYVASGGTAVLMGTVGGAPPAWSGTIGGGGPLTWLGEGHRVVPARAWGGFLEPLRVLYDAPQGLAVQATDAAELQSNGAETVLWLHGGEGTARPLLLRHHHGAGTVWSQSVDLGGAAWRWHLGRPAGGGDDASWTGWTHLHGLQWLLLHHVLLHALPGPVPVLSTAPSGRSALVNFQLHLEGASDHLGFGDTAKERDAMAALALRRAERTWGPAYDQVPWLRGNLETGLKLGLVCGPQGAPLNPNGVRLVRWANEKGTPGAHSWENGIPNGASASDWQRVANCLKALRAAGLASSKPWTSWEAYRSIIPEEQHIATYVQQGLLSRAHWAGERTSASFVPVPLSTRLATARDPVAYQLPQSYTTGFVTERTGADVELLRWDKLGLAPILGWVRDDYQTWRARYDVEQLKERVDPLLRDGLGWFADTPTLSDWIQSRERVDLHGHAVVGSRAILTLSVGPGVPVEGATVQLVGLPDHLALRQATLDHRPVELGRPSDRVVLPSLPPGDHVLQLEWGPAGWPGGSP